MVSYKQENLCPGTECNIEPVMVWYLITHKVLKQHVQWDLGNASFLGMGVERGERGERKRKKPQKKTVCKQQILVLISL